MMDAVLIREVKTHEASVLSNLAMRSKAYWGYSAKFMAACENELLVTEKKLESDTLQYMVAERKGKVIGYYALEKMSESRFELDALFVEPDCIGSGIGKALLTHAKTAAANLGGVTLTIQGDPNAQKFYVAAGGVLTGERESGSIPGRFLPTFIIPLVGDDIA